MPLLPADPMPDDHGPGIELPSAWCATDKAERVERIGHADDRGAPGHVVRRCRVGDDGDPRATRVKASRYEVVAVTLGDQHHEAATRFR